MAGLWIGPHLAHTRNRFAKFSRSKGGSDSGTQVLDVKKEGATINIHYFADYPWWRSGQIGWHFQP